MSLAVLACLASLALGIPGALALDQTFVVTSAADNNDGTCNAAHCTLREAIIAANAAAGHDTIVFNISGNGVHNIGAVNSPPIITNPVTIDATTETDYAGVPRVDLDGVGAPGGSNGLFFSVNSGTSTVRGLAINRWQAGVTTQNGTTVRVEDSYIGVHAGDGVTPRANGSGIVFLGGSNHVVESNLISGNLQVGVRFQDVTGATVRANRIGTNAAGTAALANGLGDPFNPFSGLEIAPTGLTGASGIVIGGSGAGEGNLISGNGRSGIDIYPSVGRTVDDTTIQGNRIGTNAAGTSAIANGWHGIHIRGFGVNGPTTDTTIGGAAAGGGNTIAFNGRDGVSIDTNADPENVRNSIRGNVIHTNGTSVNHLGIDLGTDGVTANDALDADPGANDLQNFPLFTIQVETTIAGELDSAPNQDYAIDIYSSPACDESGNGEGRAFVETKSVSTDGSGHATFSTSQDLLPFPGGFVTATANDTAGNTSEFSQCFDVASFPQPGPTYTVNTTEDGSPADAGCSTSDCTLREAIEAANGQAGANTIEFAIPGAAPHSIEPMTTLPAITDTVTIDGTTQPGYGGTPLIEVDGTTVTDSGQVPGYGLRIATNDSVVRGLAINRFSGEGPAVAVHIQDGDNNEIESSYIGTDVTGTLARPNGIGIELTGASSGNTIGGSAIARNVISGNNDRGVSLMGGATGTLVDNNFIGVDATGLDPLGNGVYGIQISATGSNTVSGNLITDNASGVIIAGAASQVVDSNGIGVNEAGEVLGQLGAGVSISNSSGNSIISNTIAGHTDTGILVDEFGGTANGNEIRFNEITQSTFLGIDLDPEPRGVTANDLDDGDTGANGLQNFPVITSATVSGGDTTIAGTLNSTPGLTFQLDFFSNVSCDPSGFGEGATYRGSETVTTDAGGDTPFSHFVENDLGGMEVTATATGGSGTSEFSACVTVDGQQPGPTFTVNTTADGEPADAGCSITDCTLREAILEANGQAGPNTIEFDIAGAAPHSIVPDSPLPAVSTDVTIDATTEPGWAGAPVVEISGDGASEIGTGLAITGEAATVRGLVIGGFFVHGIDATGGQLTLEGNYIGTDVAGTATHENGVGVRLTGSLNTIGGSASGQGNLISGNVDQGLLIEDSSTNTVRGNQIGTDASGTAAIPNTTGIEIVSSEGSVDGNRIGGDQPGEGNLVSGNVSAGILLRSTAGAPGVTGTEIEGNLVGTATDGVSNLGNGGDGVQLGSLGNLSGNSVGGTGAGQGNTIAFNAGAGVSILDAPGNVDNAIRGNSIDANGGVGIDLNADGATPNDEGDLDGGANGSQNFPVIANATANETGTTINAELNSAPTTTYDIDFYASATCDPSLNGEGATYLGSTQITTGPAGNWVFPHTVSTPLVAGTEITATATGPSGTSEFSACVAVQQGLSSYVVNSSEDTTPDGCTLVDCTLREAILDANDDGTVSEIGFDLANSLVVPQTPLPLITTPVDIDGENQVEGGRVTVDGTEVAGDGLVLGPGSDGSTIRALHLDGFDASGFAAIRVLSGGNTIRAMQVSSVFDGIVLEGDEAGGNTIGGHFSADGNRLWGFSHYAIELDTAASGNELAGNTIGFDSSGAPQALTPGSTGIFLMDTAGTVIGHNVGPGGLGAIDGSRSNVIVRTTFGIFFESGVTGSIVAGNFVGVNRVGVATDLGSSSTGIELSGGSDNNQLGPGNNVAHNGSHGIRINHSDGNRIVANSIRSNGGLGISLNSANNGIAAPSLFTAVDNEAGAATVSGEIEGPSGLYFVEFFENTACDPSESGEGETYRGFAQVQITNNESAPFVGDTFLGVAEGDILTATLTRAVPPTDTSEFSLCTIVEAADAPAPPPAPVLFGAVADVDVPATPTSPLSLGVAGLVDSGQPTAGQEFDVEFFSTTACDPLAQRTSLGTGPNFVTNETGIAGFAKDGLTNVPIGTFVVAFASREGSASSPMSNCVVADRNNTSWHTAHSMTPTDTETGALRAAGEARWFKVPILPNSRVEVSLTDLPADYDLVVFSDIQQAYERLVGSDVDPALGPNLAITDLQREGAETQTDVFNTSQYDSSSWDPTNWNPNLNTNTSVFSASQWSPSQWSPSQWSASQWSASQWSPSQWSPSQWSPSQWSASQWSPSQWSSSNPSDPRAFSSAQTASLLAVSAGPGTGDETVSVNTWNNTGDFYVRVQGKNGSFDAAEELSISVDRQGSLCAGVLDQSSTPTAPAGLGAPKTLILKDTSRLDMDTPIGTDTLDERLDALAERPDVDGVVVDVDADDDLTNNVDDFTVRELNVQADAPAFRSCPFAKNLVAAAIKRIVSAYRKAYPSIQYLVVVGDDTVIPFFRYPDPALMGSETLYVPPVRDDTTSQASLRLGYILSDDFMASSRSVSRHGKRLPVPDLSAGRLVETPEEIAGMLDAYLGTTGGVVPTPTSSLTTGYDFLTDAAVEINGHFQEGIGGTANRRLITAQRISPGVTTETEGGPPSREKSWTANDLRNALLGPQRNDLIFLAGHFSANDALAADYRTNVLTTELANSSTNFVNSIVFSAGCHTGYNIVNGHATVWTEPLDWAQAFAQKRATLISGTGYQYGDTDFLAHGERIYAEFARQLRVTRAAGGAPEPVAVGQALLRAKEIFLKETPGLTSLDEKSLLQTTLFGLPMLSVNMPGERIVETPKVSIVDQTQAVGPGPGQALGLRFKGVNVGATLTPNDKQLKDGPLATWLEGPDGVAVRPTQPILPLRTFDVTPPDPNSALRGVGFRSGTYIDTGGTTPLTAAPATELRGIHGPFFSDVFFPTQPWSVNYFDALDGGATFLHTTPVQHRSESPEMTRREFSDLGLQLFYSANVTSYCPGTLPLVPTPPACVSPFGPVTAITPALAAPPTVSGIETAFASGDLTVKARVVGDPSAGIQTVWMTWTIPPALGEVGHWAPVDLVRDADDPALWTGVLPLGAGVDPGDVHFSVWAVNGVGRVTVDDNLGALYRPGSIPGNANTPPDAPDPEATKLEFTTPPPATVTFGQSFEVTVELTLEDTGAPLAGRFVDIGIGSNGIPVQTEIVNGHALATIELQASRAPGSYEVTASYPGDATHASSDVSAPLIIAPRPTSLVIGGSLTLAPSSIHAILQATAPLTPLHQRSVFLIFTGTGPANVGHTDVFAGKTDPTGRVDVTDEFLAALPAGNYRVDAFFNGVSVDGVLELPPDSPEYLPATATANLVFRPSAAGLLDQAVELLLPLAVRPGSAGDKAEDALAKVQSAIGKYSRNNRQGALGDLEGAAGDLQSGVNNRQLTNAQVRPIQELITAAAWVVALEARDRAIARGGKPSKIAEANTLITQGNQRWAQGRYKDAIARYKDAVAKAESA